MRQLTLGASKRPPAQFTFRRRLALASVALSVCDLAMAGLPAGSAAGPPLGASLAGAAHATVPQTSADTSRPTWQGFDAAEMASDWTRWLLSIPLGASPLGATETGINCAINQSGPLW